MFGEYLSIWEARSKWDSLRKRGGGGVVTTLLAYAIEKGIIENALVVRSSDKDPWAEPVIAATKEEIFDAAGSKYTFVPYYKLIKKLGEKSAIVGVPCQIASVKKLNILKIGLFSGIPISNRGIHYLLKKLRIDPLNIKHMDYRKPGGGLLVELKDGRSIKYPGYSWMAYYFSEPRCLKCRDNTNHYSDISVGDRYNEGYNNVIIRTKKGKDLFDAALKDGYIVGRQLSTEEFFSKIQTPFYWKEIRGGYQNNPFVRVYGKWIQIMPLFVLRYLGNKIARNSLKKLNRYLQSNPDIYSTMDK